MTSGPRPLQLLATAVCVLFVIRHASAEFDDSHLKALSKCAKTAQDADINLKATDMCSGTSKTYKDFITCASKALEDTGIKTADVKGHSVDVDTAAKDVREKFCKTFPFMQKFPATFYRTVQASLIVRHQNIKRNALLKDAFLLDFLYGKDRKDHIMWKEAIGDHIRKGIAAEIYTNEVGADFWKNTYGLSTPNDAQWKEIKSAVDDCLKVLPNGASAKDDKLVMKVCRKSLALRISPLSQDALIVGRSKLAGYEACVRSRYYLKQSKLAAGTREFLVMEPQWKTPAPKGGMLILSKDPKAPANSAKNNIEGEIILVEAAFHADPPDGMEDVLAFIIDIACSYETDRMKMTDAAKDMCFWFENVVPATTSTKFSPVNFWNERMKACETMLKYAKTVAFEMLEQSPWITWTGTRNADTEKDVEEMDEEVIVLQQSMGYHSCRKCLFRLLESSIKKLFCDTIFALAYVILDAISLLAGFFARVPGTDNFSLLIWRFWRCILEGALIKTAAFRQQQEELGNKTPVMDKFIEAVKQATAKLKFDDLPKETETEDTEKAPDDKAMERYVKEQQAIPFPDLSAIEKMLLIIYEGGQVAKAKAANNDFLQKLAMFCQEKRTLTGFAADVLRFFPIVDEASQGMFWLIQDMMTAYAETSDENALKVRREEDSLWTKTWKRFANVFQKYLANFFNNACDYIWLKVKELIKLGKIAGKAALMKVKPKEILDEFLEQRKAELGDIKKVKENLTKAGNEYKDAVNAAFSGKGWDNLKAWANKINEKVSKKT